MLMSSFVEMSTVAAMLPDVLYVAWNLRILKPVITYTPRLYTYIYIYARLLELSLNLPDGLGDGDVSGAHRDNDGCCRHWPYDHSPFPQPIKAIPMFIPRCAGPKLAPIAEKEVHVELELACPDALCDGNPWLRLQPDTVPQRERVDHHLESAHDGHAMIHPSLLNTEKAARSHGAWARCFPAQSARRPCLPAVYIHGHATC